MMTDDYHQVFFLVKQEHCGRAWVANRDLYYSPNCIRGISIPEHQQDIKLKPGVLRASDFQEPIWWEKKTEWLACVLRQLVPYSSTLVQALNVVPESLMSVPNKGVGMSPEQVLPWKELETTLMGMAQALKEKLPHIVRAMGTQAKPFAPSMCGYQAFYPTSEEASRHIEAGRDWFAMWLGYVYWLSRKVYEHAGYSDDSMAPMWYLHVIRACNDQPMYDLLCTTPLLQNQWKWNRVGVWLHHPDDVEEQLMAQWFVDHGVPVWYRWGGREKAAMRCGNQFSLIKPNPEDLQHATTWIAPTPSNTYTPQFLLLWSSVPYTPVLPVSDNIYSYQRSYPDGGDYSPVVWRPSPSTDPQASVSEPPVEVSLHSMMTAEAAQAVWDEFWKKREVAHERMLKVESEAKKMARLDHERWKPTVSAIVYEWGWDEDETPPIFTKKLVRKSDRAETIMDYWKEIRRYDSYMNEWHLCYKFTDELYPESSGSSTPGSPSQVSPAIENSGTSGSHLCVQKEVTPTLSLPCEAPTPSSWLLLPPSSHWTDTSRDRDASILSSSAQNEPLSVSSPSKEASMSPSLLQSSLPSLPPNFCAYASGDPKSDKFKMEQTRTEVLRLLGRCFGFVPPLPVLLAFPGHVLESDMRLLLCVLGMETDKASLDFFKTPLSKICTTFMKCFTGKGEDRLSSEFWDLARENRQTLAFNAWVSLIRTLNCISSKRWYMLDMGASRTVEWSIAVASAADTLYVCCLNQNMTEKEIALDLAEEGVCFHTVQH
ncbi:hypothetical protein NP233_g11798 [Leucocoprinus birnbaumii]|uniref:Uncharacterized protein n=1 Tax=Leucocoprinus birnbaumii TaxID=56174 RepID=A0AAD5VFV2_9AGAR|nr:hypothetical protein NP233_g11798 [Leucocoprinus birnbaumii]